MRVRTCRENKVVFNMRQVFRTTSVRERSNADVFYHQKMVSTDDGLECVAVVDPIIMLFNQERLSKMGDYAVEQWLKSMEDLSNSPLSKLRRECSDDDLLYMIKSRHIQAPCELTAWTDYMAANMDKFKNLMAAELADKKAKEAASLETSKNTE